MEGRHHIPESILVVCDFVPGREGIADTPLGQLVFENTANDITKGHCGAEFGADHFELSRNPIQSNITLRFALLVHLQCSRLNQGICQVRMLGQAGYDGHQVALTCSVIADHQKPTIVCGLIELHMREDNPNQPLGHLLRDDVRGNQMLGFRQLIGIPQLDDILNGVELNQIAIFHPSFPSVVTCKKSSSVGA